MKNLLFTTSCLLLTFFTFAQQTKLQQDREAILSFVGCTKVTFDFAETFAPDTAYKYHDRYSESGIEYIFVIENSEKLISLQHLLIVNDSFIVKHWRQDWVYESTELLNYYKDNEWKKTTYTPEQVKGQWSQKVYSVDDSPRYQAKGTWHHEDGRSFWEGTGDAPLPRREYTHRSDYNVVTRHSHIETSPNGWFLEQDNKKIIRSDAGDKLLCEEKGMEAFTKGDYNCQAAINYWEKNKAYWADVRTVWEKVYAKNATIKLENKVDNTRLFDKLFELEKETDTKGKGKDDILKAIELHLKS